MMRRVTRSIRSASLLLFLLGLSHGLAGAQDSPGSSTKPTPTIRINAPFAAPLWRIDIDASETHIIAGSANNAVTAWSLNRPDLENIHRVPLRAEERQRARAVAITPDGRLIAYSVPPLRTDAGFPIPGTARIYVLQRQSGEILKIIEGVATRPQALKFSPTGEHLAATLSDGCGLRVWATKTWKPTSSDDVGHGGAGTKNTCCKNGAARDCAKFPDTTELIFNKGSLPGIWLITSGDTGVRTYAKQGDAAKLVLHKTPAQLGLARPEGVALSPDGKNIAVGDRRIPDGETNVRLQVGIFHLATLKAIRKPLVIPESAIVHPGYFDPKQAAGADQMNLTRVAWGDVDGDQFVFAGGTFWCQIANADLIIGEVESPDLAACMVRWQFDADDFQKEPKVNFVHAGTDRVMDLRFLSKSKAIVYAGQRRIGAIDVDGEPFVNDRDKLFLRRSRVVDLRDRPVSGRYRAFDISDDAQKIYFQDYSGSRNSPINLVFDVDKLTLKKVSAAPEGVKPPKFDPLLVEKRIYWWNKRKPPKLYDTDLSFLAEAEGLYRNVALASDERAVIASSNFITVVGFKDGEAAVLCRRRVDHEAFRINLTSDGSLAVVGHSDGTIRWYRISKGVMANTCRLEHLLSVHIRRIEDGGGEWTWTAWIPTSGHFAADANAKSMVAWQTTTKNGQVALVPFRKLLRFYKRDIVRKALTPNIVSAKDRHELAVQISKNTDPLLIEVYEPDDGERVEITTVNYFLNLKGSKTWPRKLQVVMGNGTLARKKYQGRSYAADEPITVAKAGQLKLDVILPPSVRRENGNVQVCFKSNSVRTCHTLDWGGPKEPRAPRRLWAVIIGFSKYKEQAPLKFAQNDALDLARLFIADYKTRVLAPTPRTKADFASINIDLIVAPSTKAAMQELQDLGKLDYVTLHPPTVDGIYGALEKLAARHNTEDLSNDLVLFYFSGHGLNLSFNRARGHTALLMPAAGLDYTRKSLVKTALTSDRLLTYFEAINIETIAILDACRVTSATRGAIPFDPGIINKEFEEGALMTHFLFSARAGQYSLDQADNAFAMHRPDGERGNGLFTYALLNAMTRPEADDTGGKKSGRNKIELREVNRYLASFFDQENKQSAAQKLIAKLRAIGEEVTLQEPQFVPARSMGDVTTVIRSLDAEVVRKSGK